MPVRFDTTVAWTLRHIMVHNAAAPECDVVAAATMRNALVDTPADASPLRQASRLHHATMVATASVSDATESYEAPAFALDTFHAACEQYALKCQSLDLILLTLQSRGTSHLVVADVAAAADSVDAAVAAAADNVDAAAAAADVAAAANATM